MTIRDIQSVVSVNTTVRYFRMGNEIQLTTYDSFTNSQKPSFNPWLDVQVKTISSPGYGELRVDLV